MSSLPEQIRSERWWELLPDHCCAIDAEARILVVNSLFADAVGRAAEELQGVELAQLMHPDDGDLLASEMLGGRTTRARLLRTDGSFAELEWRSSATEDVVVLTARIVEAAQAPGLNEVENELRLQRQWLRKSELMAGVGHWHLSLVDSELFWSEQIYRIHGLDPETHTPDLTTAIEAYHPDDRAMVIADVEKCRDSGEPFETRCRLLRPDGSVRYVWSRGERWDGPDGQPLALFGVFTDLTDSLELSERLERSEARYRDLYNRTPALLYSADAQGRFLEVSDLWLARMGYSRDQVLGRRVFEFFSPETQSLASHIKNQYLRTGACSDIPIRFLRRDGKPLDVLLSAVSENDSSGGVVRSHVACQDITSQIRAERALEETHTLILRKNRELKEIAVAASHDLKAPVRNIRMFTSLLNECCNEESREYLGYVAEAGYRLQMIVNDLSRYMALEEDVLGFKKVDLKEVVENVLRGLHSVVLESQARVEVADLPVVVGAPKQIYSLFENVLSNSLKFRGTEPPHVRLECEESDIYWTFTLQDNGVGVPEKFREEVFKLFRRLHSADEYEGSGAGLAMAKKVVDHHGGEIRFLSSEDGARLQFSLRKMVLGEG